MEQEPALHHPRTLGQLLRRRLVLVLAFTAAATGLAAVLISPSFKPDEYQSRVVLVVPNLRNAKTLTFLKSDFAGYGVATDRELRQVQAALESEAAFQYMVENFRLLEHYGLQNLTNAHHREKTLRGYYRDRVHIDVIRRATLSITVYDRDPQMASRMANAFITYADRFIETVIRREKGLQELEQSIFAMRLLRSQQEDSTALLLRGQLQMYNFDNLAESVSGQIVQELLRNPAFAQKYDRMQSAEQRIKFLEAHLAAMTSEYNYRRENLRIYPSLLNVAAAGLPAALPARPNRPLYIALSGLSALLAAVATVWLVDGLIFDPQTHRTPEPGAGA
jgi:capsular polysaccharide biosynthesis protein